MIASLFVLAVLVVTTAFGVWVICGTERDLAEIDAEMADRDGGDL